MRPDAFRRFIIGSAISDTGSWMTGDGTSLGHEHVSFVLRNETMTGVVQEFNHLVFHGGLGATLEMRVFSETALIQHLKGAGFANIKVHRAGNLVHGIWWPESRAFPVLVRKPKG